MSSRSKREYLEAIYLRYKRASRKDKTIILDEFCTACGYHRKHAIRLLKKFTRYTKQSKKKSGRTSLYNKGTILKPLKKIWLSANLPCSKRLKAILPLWLPSYVQEYGDLPSEVTEALLTVSHATIDRLLKPVRVKYKGRGRATTKPGTLLRKQIPIKTNQSDESRPGFLEADTVAHCGTSMAGMFAFTIDCVDIATGWTEQRAVWGKGETDVPTYDSKNEIQWIDGTIEDITERKRAEAELRASEAELHNNYFTQAAINTILSESLENVPLETILQKALNIVLSVPWPSFETYGSILLVGDEPGGLAMKVYSNLPKSVQKSLARVPFGECLCGQVALTQEIQFFAYSADKCHEEMPPYSQYAVPILFGGSALGVLNVYLKEGHTRNQKEEEFLRTIANTLAGIIVRDRSEDEKIKLHAQLVQAQKMEAIGQLAGGIAHDFNNILTAIVGYGHLLKVKMSEDDPSRSYAEHILSLSDKAASLTQSLLAFSRKQIMNTRLTDINGIIRKVEKLLARIIGEDIELKAVLTGGNLIVLADPLQIEQALMNLATNAKDAMPEGGRIEINTAAINLDEAFVKTHGFGKEGKFVLVSVTDTGCGMDEKTRHKIFEPFFTTKEVGKGTGLGLAMVYGIIKQHDGYIDVHSAPGNGTTFNIYLPLIQTTEEEIRPEIIQSPERGTETILLAEDESEVRSLTKTLLEENGYSVIDAIDGEDAINKFSIYKDKIQFLILDVIMPKKNGREVYETIRKTCPDVEAIFTSGHTADAVHRKGILADVDLILKPIRLRSF